LTILAIAETTQSCSEFIFTGLEPLQSENSRPNNLLRVYLTYVRLLRMSEDKDLLTILFFIISKRTFDLNFEIAFGSAFSDVRYTDFPADFYAKF